MELEPAKICWWKNIRYNTGRKNKSENLSYFFVFEQPLDFEVLDATGWETLEASKSSGNIFHVLFYFFIRINRKENLVYCLSGYYSCGQTGTFGRCDLINDAFSVLVNQCHYKTSQHIHTACTSSSSHCVMRYFIFYNINRF